MVVEAPSGRAARPHGTRPPGPTFFAKRTEPVAGSARRRLRQLALQVLDRAPGLCPLQTHVVMCGFPRSGSTLLQLVAEACYPGARAYRAEKSALNAAKELVRTHALMITKRPSDLFHVDEIRSFYAPLRTHLRFVLTMRDPRATLTSKYSGDALANVTRGPDGYVMSVSNWQEWFAHFRYVAQGGDAMVVEYADLVRDPVAMQQRYADFIGWAPEISFDQFMESVPAGFATKALNGLRSFDPSNLDRWKQEKYRERLRQILDEMPELPELLIELGYETTDEWVRAYR
jgi:hypothetical protein